MLAIALFFGVPLAFVIIAGAIVGSGLGAATNRLRRR